MARVGGRLYWLGDQVKERVVESAKAAIDATTEAAAEHARSNHPGWRTVTGTAERSIGIRPARELKGKIRGSVTGGDGEAFYLMILEVKKGAALRTAGDVVFPSLPGRLADEYGRRG